MQTKTKTNMVTGPYIDRLWVLPIWQPQRLSVLFLQQTALPQSLVQLLLEFAKPRPPEPAIQHGGTAALERMWSIPSPIAEPEYDRQGRYGMVPVVLVGWTDDSTNIAYNF
jgi:hypothetical protein